MENKTEVASNVFDKSAYSKPKLHVILNRVVNVIEFDFDSNEDILKLLKENVSQAKHNKATKTYQAPITQPNIERANTFLNACYATLGDIRKIFNFEFKVVKNQEVEPKQKFDLMKAINSEIGDLAPSMKERVDYKEEKKASEAIEGEVMPKNSKGNEKDIYTNGLILLADQKRTYSQIKEIAVYDIIKDDVAININNEMVYYYDENTKIFESKGLRGSIKPQVTKVMLTNGLENYTSDKDVESVVKSIENYLQTDNKKKDLVVKYFNVDSDKGVLAMVMCENKKGRMGFRVVDACRENMAIVNMKVKIDSSKIINEETGKAWNGIESLRKSKFFYDFKIDESQDIHTLYLNKLFASKNHYKVAKMMAGNIFTGRKVSKFFMLIGEGEEGKSEYLEAKKEMYGIDRTVNFKLEPSSGGENFKYQNLLTNPIFAYITEVNKDYFDEVMFKNLTGDRHVPIPVKGSYPRNIDTTTMEFMVVMNYTNLFRIPNIDRSMIRRICAVKAVKSDGVKIIDIMRKMMNGEYCPELKKTFKPQRLEFFHWMLEGAIESFESNAFTESTMEAEVYGEDVAEFNKDVIEIMAGSNQFLKDEEFEYLRDGTLTRKSHIMEYYLQYCDENNVPAKERIGTKKLIDSIILKATNDFGYNLSERMRCKLEDGKLVDGLPIRFKHDSKARENIFMTNSIKSVARSKVLHESVVAKNKLDEKNALDNMLTGKAAADEFNSMFSQ